MPRKIQDDPRPRIESPGSWRSAPRPVDWLARVEYVLQRDQVCQWPQGCDVTEDLEVDHAGKPDDHHVDRLRALCKAHHRYRTNQQARARRPKMRRDPERHPGLIYDDDDAA
ncbi:HNH endonuclease signature motif containing protein [Nonomuraea sp. CA-218870]|uniref:HNH endonuclease signature motif containing protein n=1 Tax=Nonomuraea sp. CA-218870 TaxID=3239998 RepID=UPI003D8D3C7F